jgi:Tfp pilus assembly protein PilF
MPIWPSCRDAACRRNDRVADTRDAIGHFERATRLDPEFANAYVSLADAKLFVAEYEVTDDRAERFEAALREGRELVQRALAIDPENGDAYLQRAHLTAYDDLSAAEADFRKGLALSPNSAEGYAGLATVLYADPARREEALQMLEARPQDRSPGAGLRRQEGRLPLVRAQRRQRRGQAVE